MAVAANDVVASDLDEEPMPKEPTRSELSDLTLDIFGIEDQPVEKSAIDERFPPLPTPTPPPLPGDSSLVRLTPRWWKITTPRSLPAETSLSLQSS